MSRPAEVVVVDASALVDLLAGTDISDSVVDRLRGTVLHAPAHVDAEVFSALGRLQRAGELSARALERALGHLADVPMTRHLLPDLLAEAWAQRSNLRLVDALYAALASRLDVPLLTTDARLARACPRAKVIES